MNTPPMKQSICGDISNFKLGCNFSSLSPITSHEFPKQTTISRRPHKSSILFFSSSAFIDQYIPTTTPAHAIMNDKYPHCLHFHQSTTPLHLEPMAQRISFRNQGGGKGEGGKLIIGGRCLRCKLLVHMGEESVAKTIAKILFNFFSISRVTGESNPTLTAYGQNHSRGRTYRSKERNVFFYSRYLRKITCDPHVASFFLTSVIFYFIS